ncbi:hypothetical protein NZD89_07890 [Alicyclobacillus fastidiosus]|uniref:PepSY domain-containing protein n=1 Tax=Alicyclobacillus fastidiosus TaxID=392011 RepID=A0ABY6ZK51_9BACL|nr:hypothetical protein [Alicyclobacillus fastidiosus]WAH43305.1 hypothetical protein NZD89_07890 [Alicyclobacillus fastidiosus]GMA65358.1 hypothetical protein GCM10025859_57980 [Alicyclobacillus fastidiosus]
MKKWLVSLSVIGCLTCTTCTVFAADGSSHPKTTPTHTTLHPVTANVQSTEGPNIHDWGDIKSSVQVTRDTLRAAYQASHDAYTKKLQKYAKCSPSAAKKAVVAEHPGMTVDDIQLRNIRTNLVYMSIVRDDEDKYLVVVDAGNGSILVDKRLPTHNERVFANRDDSTK